MYHKTQWLLYGKVYHNYEYSYTHTVRRKSKMAANMQELSSDNLAQILRELFTVQSKWYNIGLSLGLNPATLDNINNTTNDACLRDMLNQRINQGGLTWEKIAKALEEVIVGRKGVARQIRARHLPPVATQAVLTTGNPTATRPLSSTNPVNPTAGPSNPSGSYPHNSAISFAIPIPVVPPPKTKPGPGKRPLDAPKPGPGKRPLVLDRQKPGPGKRPLDRPIAGPSKVSLLCTIYATCMCIKYHVGTENY